MTEQEKIDQCLVLYGIAYSVGGKYLPIDEILIHQEEVTIHQQQSTREFEKMDNQHKKIKGYRDLTEDEIAAMNELKAMGNDVGALLDRIKDIPDVDQRFLATGRTDIQKGFMCAVRSIARPETFA